MAAEAELVVGLVEAAEAGGQLRLAIGEFKTGARNDVDHPIRAVAELGRIAAARNLYRVDVLGVHGAADVAGDVGVRHGHAVHQPAHLVPAAHVQVIVQQIRAGYEIGDICQAAGPVRAGRVLDLQLVNRHRTAGRVRIGNFERSRDFRGGGQAAHRHRKMQHRCAADRDIQRLAEGLKSLALHLNAVRSGRHRGKSELADAVRLGFEVVGGPGGLERDLGPGNHLRLRVLHVAAQGAEDLRVCEGGSTQQQPAENRESWGTHG